MDRGESGGDSEDRITGTTIKDTWTKSMGRVGREGGLAGVGRRNGEKRHTTEIE